ncbi:MAG TPA: hypothetical protein VJ732_02420 [Bryobacteraceae bacterium]|nr:hypothetical protein [Bryobacteraceae bacterium]
MLECLRLAQKAYLDAPAEAKPNAYRHYITVLGQFNALVLNGAIPPEEPCYAGTFR